MKPAYSLHLVACLVLIVAGFSQPDGLVIAVALWTPLFLLCLLLVRRIDPTGELRFAEIFTFAVTIRWVIAALSYMVINRWSPGVFSPDEFFYDLAARQYADYLAGRVPNPYPDSFVGGVIGVSSVIYYVLGFTPMVPRLLNGLLGGWNVILTGLIAARFFNPQVARRAAFINAVTPSLALFAGLNAKDNATLFGVELATLAFLHLRERFRLEWVALFAAALLCIASNRPYEVVFVSVGAAVSILMGERAARFRNVFVAVAMGAAMFVILQQTGATSSFQGDEQTTMETVAKLRTGFATGAGSAVNIDLIDTSTAGGLALWAPLGLFYFFFAPIPFTGTSGLSLATSPEMFVWYLFLGSAWRGMRIALRGRFKAILPLLVYLGASSIGWSLVITNTGTLYRYRAQVMFIPIIFIAADQVRRKYYSGAATAPAARWNPRNFSRERAV